MCSARPTTEATPPGCLRSGCLNRPSMAPEAGGAVVDPSQRELGPPPRVIVLVARSVAKAEGAGTSAGLRLSMASANGKPQPQSEFGVHRGAGVEGPNLATDTIYAQRIKCARSRILAHVRL